MSMAALCPAHRALGLRLAHCLPRRWALHRHTSTTTTSSSSATSSTTTTSPPTSTASPAVVGIDLGTTNSCVGVMEGGVPRLIPADGQGHLIIPSVVSLAPGDGSPLHVGRAAQSQAVLRPRDTFFATKRLLGRKMDDPVVQEMAGAVPYGVAAAPNGDAWLRTSEGELVSPPQIAAHVLASLKEAATTHLNVPVEHAVITVPAYFNDSQRQATRDAGELAGLKVLRVVNEPTAAALVQGLGDGEEDKTVAVFDLGGGTFDVSVLRCGAGFFEVRATNGDTFLGGEDFDAALYDHTLAHHIDAAALAPGSSSEQRLRAALQAARIELDTAESTTVDLPFLFTPTTQTAPTTTATPALASHSFQLTREELEAATRGLVERTVAPCRQCLRDAGCEPGDVDAVVLVGGMSRMPLVRQTVSTVFGRAPLQSADPMHAVGLGAAMQAGVLSGAVTDLVLLDVTPLSLGIETLDGLVSVVIPRNTSIPTRVTDTYSTGVDGQTQVRIHVLQGERPLAVDNHSLGEFSLVGIPPQPQGRPQIEVGFEINSDGLVRVSARDKATGLEQRIVVEPSGGLTRAKIEALVGEARTNKLGDRRRAARAQELASARALLADVGDNLQRFAAQLDAAVPGQREELEALHARALAVVDDSDQPLAGARAVQDAALAVFRKAAHGAPQQNPGTDTDTIR